MAGVRLDGILQVDDAGGAIPVDATIVAPLPLPTSSTPAANISVTGTLNALNEEVTIDVPDGYNSVTLIITSNAPSMTLVALQGSVASGAFSSPMQGYDFINGIWQSQIALTAGSGRRVISYPVVSGKPFSIVVAVYASGSIDVELVASQSVALGTPLTNIELRATPSLVVNTELPTAAALGDAIVNPTAPAVGAFGMFWNGATWSRIPGSVAGGLLVNLGANNDVTVTGAVTLLAPGNVVSTKTAIQPQIPAFVLVGIISALAVAAAATRKGLIITNTSPNIINLAFAPAPAVLGSGIALAAGATFKMDEYSFSTLAINAISNVGGSNLSIQEFI
jgi:hypothetical protein